jgi:hypothetical protein
VIKNRNVEYGIGSQLVQLNPVDQDKSPKELMNKNRKAMNEEVRKDYSISFGWIGGRLIPRSFRLLVNGPQFL